jgi:hypothetical protein
MSEIRLDFVRVCELQMQFVRVKKLPELSMLRSLKCGTTQVLEVLEFKTTTSTVVQLHSSSRTSYGTVATRFSATRVPVQHVCSAPHFTYS